MRYVYNFDLPNVPDNYVHRIGRTARAGRDGTAIAYCAPTEMDEFRAIQKVMGRKIEVASGEEWEGEKKPARGGNGGGRRRGGGGGGNGGGHKPGTTQPRRSRSRRGGGGGRRSQAA